MSKPTLFLMAGYPGAGKTTIASIISELTGAAHLSSDSLRIEMFPQPMFSPAEHTQLYNALNTQTKALLQAGKSVIYDANLNRYEHRQEKYDICQEIGATPQLIWVTTPKQLAKERATHESRNQLIPQHETKESMFERIADIIEPPKKNESPIFIDGSNVDREAIRTILAL